MAGTVVVADAVDRVDHRPAIGRGVVSAQIKRDHRRASAPEKMCFVHGSVSRLSVGITAIGDSKRCADDYGDDDSFVHKIRFVRPLDRAQ